MVSWISAINRFKNGGQGLPGYCYQYIKWPKFPQKSLHTNIPSKSSPGDRSKPNCSSSQRLNNGKREPTESLFKETSTVKYFGLATFPAIVTTKMFTVLVGDSNLNLHECHHYWEVGGILWAAPFPAIVAFMEV